MEEERFKLNRPGGCGRTIKKKHSHFTEQDKLMYIECRACHHKETIRKRFGFIYLFAAVAGWCMNAFMVYYVASFLVNALLVAVFVACMSSPHLWWRNYRMD